jgi:hypothetical protein
VSSNDYADGRAAPQLSRYMAGKHEEVKTAMAVPEIVGHVDADAIAKQLQSSCGGDWLLKVIVSKSPTTDNARRVQQLQSEGMKWRITNALCAMAITDCCRCNPRGIHRQRRKVPGLHRHLHHHAPD